MTEKEKLVEYLKETSNLGFLPLGNKHIEFIANVMLADRKRVSDISFKQGYYCAVANLKSMHDTGLEKELLRAYGSINFDDIEEHDVKALEYL